MTWRQRLTVLAIGLTSACGEFPQASRDGGSDGGTGYAVTGGLTTVEEIGIEGTARVEGTLEADQRACEGTLCVDGKLIP